MHSSTIDPTLGVPTPNIPIPSTPTPGISSGTCRRLMPLAEQQWGLITRRQAEQAGVAPATFTRMVRSGVLQRVAHGVYLNACLVGRAPTDDHLHVRAAWLQLAPHVPARERTPDQGVISHRSAATIYGIARERPDRHEFLVPRRRQSRRRDVRLRVGTLEDAEVARLHGLPVTRPARIATDLLAAGANPAEVGQVIAGALRVPFEYRWVFGKLLAPHAAALGLKRGDGLAALHRLLDLGERTLTSPGVPPEGSTVSGSTCTTLRSSP
jgi:hypothetical protein